jgi:ribosomal RNA-processing protein 12
MTRFLEEDNEKLPEDIDVAAHILKKHGRSTQPESKQICVVLGAVSEVLKDEGYSPTPTAYFAAIMSLLEKPETQESPQVPAAHSPMSAQR